MRDTLPVPLVLPQAALISTLTEAELLRTWTRPSRPPPSVGLQLLSLWGREAFARIGPVAFGTPKTDAGAVKGAKLHCTAQLSTALRKDRHRHTPDVPSWSKYLVLTATVRHNLTLQKVSS
jgi:hypothetical protein